MRPVNFIAVVVLIALAAGCQGKNPAAPSQSAAQIVTGLVINGVDAVVTGSVNSYTLTATLSDGTTRAVTPTWTSSRTDVASVDSAGRLDGLSHGATTLTASYMGGTASKTVQVVNNYGGTWVGQYVIKACDQSGYFERAGCESSGRVGQVLPITLALSQTGSTKSEIRGTLVLNRFPYLSGVLDRIEQNISGVVTEDGRLILGGSSTIQSWDDTYTFQVGEWDTNVSGPGVMTGHWTQTLGVLWYAGKAFQENELVTMTPTSNGAASTGGRP
jgi:hypothetical protein